MNLELLHSAMCHEADECIMVGDERPFDPHKNEFVISLKA